MFCGQILVLVSVCLSFCLSTSDFYSFKVEDHLGEEVSLEKYRGKVTLVVNVASLCGYTDNTYRSLSKIHDILSHEGFFSVLAFPCNQFGDQEPEDAETVSNNMKEAYQIEFPIFNKIDVVGEKASPAFRNLIEQSSRVPEWNFYKYLVGPDGEIINSYGTRTEIEDIFSEAQSAIEKAKLAAVEKKEDDKPAEKSTEGDEPKKDEL